MSKITQEMQRKWKRMLDKHKDHSVLHQLIDALVEDEPEYDHQTHYKKDELEPEPAAIEWKAGDYAWDKGIYGLIHIEELAGPYVRFTHKGGGISLNMVYLSIPTRDQLAVEIGDSGVKAWAWESNSEFISLATSNEIEDGMYDRIIIEALNIPIVSADQVTRHFGGNYSPEATE